MRTFPILTISLCSFDLLKESLEPTERRRVAADPEKLDTLEGPEVASLLTIPDVLKDGRERSDTCAPSVNIQEKNARGWNAPIPAPTSTATSTLNTSSAGAP